MVKRSPACGPRIGRLNEIDGRMSGVSSSITPASISPSMAAFADGKQAPVSCQRLFSSTGSTMTSHASNLGMPAALAASANPSRHHLVSLTRWEKCADRSWLRLIGLLPYRTRRYVSAALERPKLDLLDVEGAEVFDGL